MSDQETAQETAPMDYLELPVAEIVQYTDNPRNNDHAVPQMAAIIRAHGFRVPVLVYFENDVAHMIDGHLRAKAAIELGMETIPALDCTGMGEKEIQAFRIAVNQASGLAEWNPELLRQEVLALDYSDDQVLTDLGFEDLPPLPTEVEPVASGETTTQAPITLTQSADRTTAKADTDMVSLSLRMTVAQRRDAMDTLDRIKEAQGLETRADAALYALQHTSPAPRARSRPRG